MAIRENFTYTDMDVWLNEKHVTEIECLVPKLNIQVYGRGGSRRAGEQAAAKLALDVAEQALLKSPAASRKPKPRAAQLKLAGIATIQSDDAQAPAAPAIAAHTKQNRH